MSPFLSAAFCPEVMLKTVLVSIALITSFALTAVPASAGETVLGGGRLDCNAYLESDEAIKLTSESWVLGFLSSANLRSRNIDLLSQFDNGTVIDAVERYCQQHPAATISDASVALLQMLVASADGDCLEGPGARRRPGVLSLCHVPGAADSTPESRNWQMRTPGAE